MLLPKRVKHRKQHRGRMTGRAMRGNKIAHGDYGLVALEPAWITNRQIEAARIVVKPGRVMFEMNGVSEEIAKEAMRLASHKLPIKTKFVTRAQQEAEAAAQEKGGEA